MQQASELRQQTLQRELGRSKVQNVLICDRLKPRAERNNLLPNCPAQICLIQALQIAQRVFWFGRKKGESLAWRDQVGVCVAVFGRTTHGTLRKSEPIV
jgi:hypothetical protein